MGRTVEITCGTRARMLVLAVVGAGVAVLVYLFAPEAFGAGGNDIVKVGDFAVGDGSQNPLISANGSTIVGLARTDTDDDICPCHLYARDVETGTDDLVSDGLTRLDGYAASSSGRYIVFQSGEDDLVPGDTNDSSDIFLRDTLADTTTRASVTTGEAQANGGSAYPFISSDGRYVAFQTWATNLASEPRLELIVRDTTAGTTTAYQPPTDMALPVEEIWLRGMSGNGRYLVFEAYKYSPLDSHVFRFDRVSGTSLRVDVAHDGTQANYSSSGGGPVSDDGRYVTFTSPAANLVPGDTNGTIDVFVRDVEVGTTTRVSVADDESQAQGFTWAEVTDISGDGRYVVFTSWATNLVPGDTNNTTDVFVRDRVAGTTTRMSVKGDGTQPNASSGGGSISDDGTRGVFFTGATNLGGGPGTYMWGSDLPSWPDNNCTASGGASPYWPGWDIVRGITLCDSSGGWTLDGWGGLHAWGKASTITGGPYWPGWDIARGIAVPAEHDAAVIVDGWGGLHRFGSQANTISLSGGPYWQGWDIARGVSVTDDGTAGTIVDGWGGLHRFGSQANTITVSGGPYWQGWDIARDVALLPDGTGGYVLDGWGGLHPFGAAPPPVGGPYWQGWDIARGVAIAPDAKSGMIIDGWGGRHPFTIPTP